MKKLLKFLFILFVGVISCACVNMFAARDLNQRASELIEDGDLQGAISRLEASVDLDDSIYESRYNLASAYMSVNRCDDAMEQARAAININDKEPIAHYTYGVACQCVADNLFKTKDKDGNIVDVNFTGNQLFDINQKYSNLLKEANKGFNQYIKLAPNAEDSNSVMELVRENIDIIENIEQNPNYVKE